VVIGKICKKKKFSRILEKDLFCFKPTDLAVDEALGLGEAVHLLLEHATDDSEHVCHKNGCTN
jgi:hypothetical protein